MNLSALNVASRAAFVAGTIPARYRGVVISTLRLFPLREERRQLLAILRSVQGPIQAQPHCQSCRIYEEDGFEDAVLYVERWDSESEFERHVSSELYLRILAAVEFSHKQPEIAFDYISTTRAMDLIESLRHKPQQIDK